MFEQIISLIAPHKCLSCNREGYLLCYECRHNLPQPRHRCYKCLQTTIRGLLCGDCRDQTPLYVLEAATAYEGCAKELVHRLKFERAKAAAATIAQIMGPSVHFDGFPLVTHIPTATSRTRARGYDQAALIAAELASLSGLTHVTLLARTGQQRQVGQNRAVRRKQLQTVFRSRHSEIVANRDILLVDDVLTTGSTIEAAATVLASAGARHIYAVVFASA